MKKICVALIAFVLFTSHVMYLKLDTYFLAPNTSATIKLFNGTFDQSENVIDLDRMLDVSLIGNGTRIEVDEAQWSEEDSVTLLNFQTGEASTWLAGVSTASRSIAMDAVAFNTYLEHEGILDMLDWRRNNDELEDAAVEKYSKHVKTIFQVGDKRTNDWQTTLGYPIEFIPLDNPYDLNTGDSLEVKLLLNGKPLANQLVYADFKGTVNGHTHEREQKGNTEHGHGHENGNADEEHEHLDTVEVSQPNGHRNDDATEEAEHGHSHEGKNSKTADQNHDKETGHGHSHDAKTEKEHSHDDESELGHSHEAGTGHEHSHDTNKAEAPHQHTSGQQLRTDTNGIATAKLTADGIWYLQTIHLVKTQEEGFTHESNWATLTFEVTHGHGEDTHSHTHEEEEGIPSYFFWIGSLLLIGVLFYWFNRKN